MAKGFPNGLDAPFIHNRGRKAAELAQESIKEVIGDGLGGTTSIGIASMVAELAKKQGSIIIGIFTVPFTIEKDRRKIAETVLKRIAANTDLIIRCDPERLRRYLPNMELDNIFLTMDEIIVNSIQAISEIISNSKPGEEFKKIIELICTSGDGILFIGDARENDRYSNVVNTTLQQPLFQNSSNNYKGCLMKIEGGADTKTTDFQKVL